MRSLKTAHGRLVMRNLRAALVSAAVAVPITALLWLFGVVQAFENLTHVFAAMLMGVDPRQHAHSPITALVMMFVTVAVTIYNQIRY